MFGSFRKKRPPDPMLQLLDRVIVASRVPSLYLAAGVPDTFEGRFESLTLHAFLAMNRLRQLPEPAGEAAQDFIDHVFAHLDLALRQAGISDVAVPKRMKKLAQGFYGRVEAYDAALISGENPALAQALSRNVTAGGDSAMLARYVVERVEELSTCTFAELLQRDPFVRPLIVKG